LSSTVNCLNTLYFKDDTGKYSKSYYSLCSKPDWFMHIGGIRTAIFAWAWARKNNGTFILRIEDTDKVREVDGSMEHIMECLTWLGITWDFGPDKQETSAHASNQSASRATKNMHSYLSKKD
jgi:glutamyl-tRNA synthetase